MSASTKPFRLTNPVHFLALGFGTGLLPGAPGTWGTLVGVALYCAVAPLMLPVSGYLALCALLFVAGIPLCGRSARDAGVHDHSAIVWDEIAGFMLTMTLAPFDWRWIVAGFLLFRAFDVLKPWPISWFDRRVKGGLGIMLDDILAGLAACATLHLLMRWVA